MIYKLNWITKGNDKAFQLSNSYQSLLGIKRYLIEIDEIPENGITITKEEEK